MTLTDKDLPSAGNSNPSSLATTFKELADSLRSGDAVQLFQESQERRKKAAILQMEGIESGLTEMDRLIELSQQIAETAMVADKEGNNMLSKTLHLARPQDFVKIAGALDSLITSRGKLHAQLVEATTKNSSIDILFALREQNGWTAVQTMQHFERLDLPVPKSLSMEVQAELGLKQDEVGGGPVEIMIVPSGPSDDVPSAEGQPHDFRDVDYEDVAGASEMQQAQQAQETSAKPVRMVVVSK